MKNILFVAATIYLAVVLLGFTPNLGTTPSRLVKQLSSSEEDKALIIQTYEASTKMQGVYASTLFVIYGLFALSVLSDAILAIADKKRHNQMLERDGSHGGESR